MIADLSQYVAKARYVISNSRVARDFFGQGIAGYAGALLMFLRGLVLAALLPPSQLGVVATVSLLSSYAQFVDLGTTTAMELRMPELSRTPKTRERLDGIRRAGFSGKIIGTLMASALLGAYLLLFRPESSDVTIGLLCSLFLFPLQGLSFAQQSYLRATRAFGSVARVVVFGTLANLLGALLGGLLWGLKGVLFAQIGAAFFSVLYGFRRGVPLELRLPAWCDLRELLHFGGPLVILVFAQYSLVYVDQIVALASLGRSELGAYSLVTAFGTMLYLVPMAVSSVIGPRLLGLYNPREDVRQIAAYCWRPTEALRIVMPALIGVAWAFVWILYTFVLPKYLGVAGPATLIYLTSIYFLGVNLGPNATLIAIRKHIWNVPIILLVIAINVVVDWFFVQAGRGVAGIAWGSVVAYGCYMTLHLGLVLKQFTSDRRVLLSTLSHYLWPGIAMSVSVGALMVLGLGTSVLSIPWVMLTAAVVTGGAGWHNRRVQVFPFSGTPVGA